MAGAAGGHDIELLFGVLGGGSIAGASGASISKDLNAIMSQINSKPLGVKVKLDAASASSFKQNILNLSRQLNNQPVSIQVSKIDATAAIEGFRSQLTGILNTISLENGKTFSVAVGGDIGTVASDVKKVGDQAGAAKQQVSALAGAIADIKATQGSLQSKTITMRGLLGDTAEASALQAKIVEVNQAYAELQAMQNSKTPEATMQAQVAKVTQLQSEMFNLLATTRKYYDTHKAEAGSTQSSLAGQKASYQQVLDLYNKINKYITQNPRIKGTDQLKDLESMRTQLRGLMDEATRLKRPFVNLSQSDFRTINTDVRTLTGELKAAGKEGNTLAGILGSAYKKFGTWTLVTRTFMLIVRQAKKAVAAVKEIDAAMTELKKVTNETDSTYEKFLQNASSRAKAVGASVKDVVSATADFARLGYGIEDASALADTAIIYKNIGDGIEDISEASDSIVSTMQAFGIEASSAMEIVDKFNIVGNNYAISSAGIGVALQKSAAAMHAANNTLDETIALAAAANTVVQNPEIVGTTLKTVSMYLRAAKTDAEEAGESTDGMAESVSELREELLALTGNKVDIQIDDDTFKSTYQILKELSQVWGSLSDVSQANITELIGGKRNANVISALLENFSVAEKAIKTAADSSGSALAENKKQLESVAGHISKFTAAFETMSNNLIGSDMVKFVVDLGTALVNVLNVVGKITSAIVAIKPVLTAVIGIIAIKNISSIFNLFTKAGKWLGDIGHSIYRVGNDIAGIIPVTKMLKSQGATSAQALSGALDAVGVSASVAQIAVSALIAAVTIGIMIWQAAKQANEESIRSAQEAVSAYNDQQESAENYKKEISDLKESMASGTLTYQEYLDAESRLIEINKEVVDTFGAQAAGFDAVTQSANAAAAAIDGYTEASLSNTIAANQSEFDKATRKMEQGSDYVIQLDHWGLFDTDEFGNKRFTDGLGKIRRMVTDAVESLGGVVQTYEDSESHMYAQISFLGLSARDAEAALISLADTIREMQRQGYDVDALLGNFDTDAHEFAQEIERNLGVAQKIISDYGLQYDLYIQAKVIEDDSYSGYMTEIENIENGLSDLLYDSSLSPEERADEINKLNGELVSLLALIGDINDPATFGGDEGIQQYFVNLINELQIALSKAELRAGIELYVENPDAVSPEIQGMMNVFDAYKNADGLIDYSLIEQVLNGYKSDSRTKSNYYAESFNNLNAACAACGLSIEEAILLLSQFGLVTGYVAAETDTAIDKITSGYSKIKSEQEALSKAISEQGSYGNITLETYNELIAISDDYAACLEYENGAMQINAEAASSLFEAKAKLKAAELGKQILEERAEWNRLNQEIQELGGTYEDLTDEKKSQYDQLVAEQDQIEKNIAKYSIMRSELMSLSSAYIAWKSAQDAPESGEMYDDTQTALEQIKDGLKTGKIGTLKYKASVDLLVPDGEDVNDYMKTLNRYITDDSRGAKNFVQDLIDQGFSVEGSTLSDFELAAGTTIEDICEKLKITPEMAKAMFLELEEYGFDFNWDESDFDLATLEGEVADAQTAIEETIEQINNGEIEAPDIDVEVLEGYQQRLQEVHDKIAAIQNDPNMSAADKQVAIDGLNNELASIIAEAESEGITLDIKLAATEDQDTRTQLEEISGVLDGIAQKIDEIALKIIGDLGAGAAYTSLHNLYNELIAINSYVILDKEYKVKAVYEGSTEPPGSTPAKSGESGAQGTPNSQGGKTLVGELGRELVVSGNRYYTVGDRGAEFVTLRPGDIVFNHEDTERILSGISGARGFALKDGNAASIGISGGGGFTDGEFFGSGGSSSKAKSNSFEDQYNYHKHLVEMDQETMEEFLKWLDKAYQEAYRNGKIELDDFYKYQEEVYQGLKELFDDYLSDIDHEISILESSVGNSDEIISLAIKAMAEIEKKLAEARAAGLDENGEYIQGLEEQWLNYSETVKDLRESAEEAAKDSIDELVEYRIDMIKKELEEQKDALSEELDAIHDFYDEQRDLLQEQRDEEKYLDEQAEKRKSVADIQAELARLEFDNSAWAQKRKLELQEELADAQKELDDFEKDHALDKVIDTLDEQEAQEEARIQAEIDAIDAKLNDPQALFNQALLDISNNTQAMFEAFLEYNRKYGSGNDEDINEMWENAYKNDQEYQETHNGEHYKDIEIGNYTRYETPGPDPNAPFDPPPSSETETTEPEEPEYPPVSGVSRTLKQGHTGDDVKSLQYALNKLGYGNGGTESVDGVFGAQTASAVKDYQSAKGLYVDGIVGNKTKTSFQNDGYASGTSNATAGIHRVDELGPEYIFTSPSDGSRYRLFTGGEKVLTADATDFLYNFATSRGSMLGENVGKLIKDTFGGLVRGLTGQAPLPTITTGNIIIQGNADEHTVSEIRRAQRDQVSFILKEFGKLRK